MNRGLDRFSGPTALGTGSYIERDMIYDSFRLLDAGPLTAAENMALDEVILEETAAGRSRLTLRFLQFSPPAVLVGRHQDVAREVREDYCRQNGLDIGRRITGGGAIFFQPSALGWEVFAADTDPLFSGPHDEVLRRICETATRVLVDLGLPAHFRPRNDIEIDGRKIGGTGGTFMTGGFMVQGTLLIENEIERFLKSLRVPVEKLKKREIESLQQRVCFLNDLVDPVPDLQRIKDAFVRNFEDFFGLPALSEPLSADETAAFLSKRDYFASRKWVYGRRRDPEPLIMYIGLHQTPAGTFHIRLWVEGRDRRIRQALITGDFFCRPERLVMDLESAVRGLRADRTGLSKAIENFFLEYDGEFMGIDPAEVVEAFGSVVDRLELYQLGLTPEEANDLFLVNMRAEEISGGKPTWLLLPYCSKKTDCTYRTVPDCGRCGECSFDRMYDLARESDMKPYSIQSFEHLMVVMNEIGRGTNNGDFFVGSCCEAFFSKHQREMTGTGARGVLIKLDSTTCYDLGKGMAAYAGQFDNQTDLNCRLIERVIQRADG